MTTSWLKVCASASVVAALVLVGCKGDPTSSQLDLIACENTYRICPNARAVSSAQVGTCARSLDGPCGTTMRQYLQCASGKCDDAGAIDRASISEDCWLYRNAFRACSESDAATDARPYPSLPPVGSPDPSDAGTDAL